MSEKTRRKRAPILFSEAVYMEINLAKVEVLKNVNSKVKENSLKVVFVTEQEKSKTPPSASLFSKDHPPDLSEVLSQCFKLKRFDGKTKSLLPLNYTDLGGFQHLILAGLGKKDKIVPETFRQLGGAIAKKTKELKMNHLLISADELNFGSDPGRLLQAFTEGFLLGQMEPTVLKSSKETPPRTILSVLSGQLGTAKCSQLLESGRNLAESVSFARHLGNAPGNLMTPKIFVESVTKMLFRKGVKIEAWDKKRLEKEKMGGLLSVSKGSSEEPRLLIMSYNHGPKNKKPLCFVGKGLTFDSGGISIKPASGMEDMKFDMCGGAAVAGTINAIAGAKLKANVIGIVPLSENLIGPSANKPGDIITFRNGKTAEVNNTDAEGRLILADALCVACERKPATIIDAATLTGAMLIALGNVHTGFFTPSDDLAETILKTGQVSEEKLWRMPLTEEHSSDIRGTYADLSNIGKSRGAGSCTAAAFLQNFVDENIPWAHFDIAGTAWSAGDRLSYAPPKGATGVMVRTFFELAQKY